MSLSLETTADPLSSYHLDPRAAAGDLHWLTLVAATPDSRPVEVLLKQVRLEADRVSSKDVRLYAGGRMVSCHSWLLSAWSPLFRQLVGETDPALVRPYSALYLPDFSYAEVGLFVQLLYLGELTGLRQLRQAAAVRQLLRLFRINLNSLEVVGSKRKSTDPLATVIKQQPSAKIAEDHLVHTAEEQLVQTADVQPVRTAFKTVIASYKEEVVMMDTSQNDNEDEVADRNSSCVVSSLCDSDSQDVPARRRSKGPRLSAASTVSGNQNTCYSCSQPGCHKQLQSERDLRDHENAHRKDKFLTYLCPDCGDVFPTSKQMANHREKHKRNLVPCPTCGAMLKSRASFAAHLRAHRQEKIFSCKVCGRAFKRNYDLKVHMRVHSGVRPYACPTCGRTFALSSTLAKHRRFHTLGQSTVVFPCSECGKGFGSQEEVDQHTSHHQRQVDEELGGGGDTHHQDKPEDQQQQQQHTVVVEDPLSGEPQPVEMVGDQQVFIKVFNIEY